MAAGRIPAPGTEYGPCADDCAHRDCAATRRQAAAACRICGEPIGYERAYFVGDDGAVHASCMFDATESG